MVVGVVGRTVTLPCRFSRTLHPTASTCWGRGQVPLSKCGHTLLSTDHQGALSYLHSQRYGLHGDPRKGEASLRIHSVQEGDDGIYGCRVELPGWFNDLKINVHLTVIKDEYERITEDYTEAVVDAVRSKESQPLIVPQNIVRIAAVAILTLLTPALIYGLRRLRRRREESAA